MTTFKKLILSAVCCFIIATGSSIAGQHTTYAATTQDNTASIQASSAQKKAAIVSFAQSLKGKVRYKYGVNNVSKLWFDCSSFTKYVFAKQGISLKWGSTAQSKQGYYVSKKNLKKGDLVFFNSGGSSKKISHVGIYMGNGKFIHNTIGRSINGIMINNLSAYNHRYVTARRVG